MIQSMTGYGKAKVNIENANFNIEIKSLNSKQIDTTIKMPSIYKAKEIALRNLISEKVQRGKVELSIWKEKATSSPNYTLNNELIKAYYQQILELKKDLGLKWNIWSTNPFQTQSTDIIPTLLKMPDVMQKGEEKESENEWVQIQKGIDLAINDLLKFRLDEGKKLEADVKSRANTIAKLLKDISPFAKARIEKVKKRLSKKISELENIAVDKNRFEQELIYYLEKQDITEEQVRLDAHLSYLIETINSDAPNGKKLGFITQEIGREINTIGSKASDINMQKIVVQMKDELEKIKEQLLNIL